jgi:hypothetical protein
MVSGKPMPTTLAAPDGAGHGQRDAADPNDVCLYVRPVRGCVARADAQVDQPGEDAGGDGEIAPFRIAATRIARLSSTAGMISLPMPASAPEQSTRT